MSVIFPPGWSQPPLRTSPNPFADLSVFETYDPQTPYFDAQPHLPLLFQSHSTEKFGEVFNQTQSPQSTIECEQDVQTSSSLQAKCRRPITLSKDKLGPKEKYVLSLAEENRSWKDKTASYNSEFSEKVTLGALQMLAKRIKEEVREWTDDEVCAFLSISHNPMVTTLTLFLD